MTSSLREKIGLSAPANKNPQKLVYETYGVLDNPFPPGHKTSGNPRHRLQIDEGIEDRAGDFIQLGHSQVVVVLGTQGAGKTNLLEYWQTFLSQLSLELEEKQNKHYMVLYYTDPEPEFGTIVRKIFQELGVEHLRRTAKAGNELKPSELQEALTFVRSRELRDAFRKLIRQADEEAKLLEMAKLLLDYLMGSRILKSHTTELGLQQRLDTTEAKTQALHDVVYFSRHLGTLHGVFLFLDELEKIGGLSLQVTTKYLSATRALIDALPDNLFLMMAMVPDAYSRYTRDLPALGGRLKDVLRLAPIASEEDAFDLYEFYLEQKRSEAARDQNVEGWLRGTREILSKKMVSDIFQRMVDDSARRGVRGVIQREFLNSLHEQTIGVFARVKMK